MKRILVLLLKTQKYPRLHSAPVHCCAAKLPLSSPVQPGLNTQDAYEKLFQNSLVGAVFTV